MLQCYWCRQEVEGRHAWYVFGSGYLIFHADKVENCHKAFLQFHAQQVPVQSRLFLDQEMPSVAIH